MKLNAIPCPKNKLLKGKFYKNLFILVCSHPGLWSYMHCNLQRVVEQIALRKGSTATGSRDYCQSKDKIKYVISETSREQFKWVCAFLVNF